MKRNIIFIAILAFLLSLPSCRGENEKESTGNRQPSRSDIRLEDPNQKLSYALGLEIGGALGELRTEIDLNSLVQGVEDSVLDREPLLSPEEAEEVKLSFLQKLQEEQAEAMAGVAAKNLEMSKTFLAENKLREEVITTDSGLQYTVLREGEGPRPAPDSMVIVHYQGMLLDGTVFDSSYQRQEPALFMVSEVIPGWTEALQLMQVGSQYRLYIPPHLAYGEEGAGPVIGPNETLIFEIEMLETVETPPVEKNDQQPLQKSK
jgi:FKBP-type peptidyl-prolyl cis-trans isomerase FklB